MDPQKSARYCYLARLYFFPVFLSLPHWRIRLGTGSVESFWLVKEYSVHGRATTFLDQLV
jgi:hypothetical protein